MNGGGGEVLLESARPIFILPEAAASCGIKRGKMMRASVTICLMTTALALAACKGGGAGNNSAAAANNSSAPNSAASSASTNVAGNSSAAASNTPDGQPVTREFLIGNWAIEHGECSSSVNFDASGVMGPPAGTQWTLAGSALTLVTLDHQTLHSTVTRTGPNSMIMTQTTDQSPMHYTRCP